MKICKSVSITLLFCLLNQIVSPVAAYALTSGPTSPEASSFEPVDTTDMVNPLTGDFVYNLPLMEVPGPEGGYPLTLSYHAGLQPNEDAGWVGLGWSLNPGAINRSVNGFPDDWFGANSNRRDYWVGGVRKKTSVGVNIPIFGNAASVAFGLSFSNDTYAGRRMGWNLGVGFGIPKSPFTVGVGIGVSADDGSFTAYGQVGATEGPFSLAIGISTSGPYASASITGDVKANGDYTMSGSLNLTTNFKSVNVGIGADLSKSTQDQSLGSTDPVSSKSVAGFTGAVSSSKQGNISSYTKSVSIDLWVVSYSREKTRYWSDEQEESDIFGSLHQMNYIYYDVPDHYAYDNYSMPDEAQNSVDNPDPNKLQGGSFPSYDAYEVTAQGLGGTMRPYSFESNTITQNRFEMIDGGSVQTIQYYSNYFPSRPEFRFDNDFSNNYLQSYTDYPVVNEQVYLWDPPFSGPTPIDPGWNSGGGSGNNLAGSRYIKYYTTVSNGTVNNYDSKFVFPVADGLNRIAHTYQSGLNNHIAGFSITTSNGITYHYNLPAYAYNEEMYQGNTAYAPGDNFNRQRKHEGYAYTWHLTAITGTDYVDRGTIGQVDAADYGYWVSFEYGKWSDQYCWRNPSEGYNVDDDNSFNNVSMGKKEIYYLNRVRTRSHVAIFEKDTRKDAKGASPEIFNTNNDRNYTNDGLFNVNSAYSMRLDRIYLVNASDAYLFVPNYSTGNYSTPGRTVSCVGCELPDNIIDKYDINTLGRSYLESKAIRIIDFNYDYSLAKGTANSYEMTSTATKDGKLTLNSVKFRGKGGVSLLPSTDFYYDLDVSANTNFSGTLSSGTFTGPTNAFDVGDLLTNVGTGAYCGVVVAKGSSTNGTSVYTLKNSTYSGGSVQATLRATKNPPYSKSFYDIWGMYKSDYSGTGNDNLDRATTKVSNAGTDAWSLRKVVTGIGGEVKVNYEGDTYSKTVLNEMKPFIATNFVNEGGVDYHFNISNAGSLNLTDLFKVGDNIALITLSSRPGNSYGTHSTEDFPAPVVTGVFGNQINIKISPLHQAALLQFTTIEAGNLGFCSMTRKYGGGIRVKNLIFDDVLGAKASTNYNYNLIGNGAPNELSSGVTSYEPVSVDKTGTLPGAGANTYKAGLYQEMNRLLSLSREVPSPGVMYENVSIETEVLNNFGSSSGKIAGTKTLEFETFRDNMIGKQDVTPPRSAPRSANEMYYTRNLVLKKFVAGVGSLKRMINYDDKGRILNETISHYLDDGLEQLQHADFAKAYETRLEGYQKQGLLKERYAEAKAIWTGNGANWHIKATMIARENFPNIQTGQTVNDYVTGVRKSTVNEAFDFYSGALVRSISTDSYGNRYLTETTPAYKKYPEMGLKYQNSANKQMLSQVTAAHTYKVNSAGQKLGLIGANVSTWGVDVPVLNSSGVSIVQNDASTNGKVWRKKAAYLWSAGGQSANGLTPIANFSEFNWASPESSVASWLKVSENMLFDVYSKQLEVRNLNLLSSSVRMGYNNSKIVANASPARYYEIAYSGGEDELLATSGVTAGNGTVSTAFAHTGTKSMLVPSNGSQTFKYTVPLSQLDPVRRDYFMSVWVRGSDINHINKARLFYSIDGQPVVFNTPIFTKIAAGWYLIEMKIPASVIASGNNNLSVGCANTSGGGPLYFDDFRFHPLTAGMNTYVYDTFSGEMTHVLDGNNLYLKYEYDAAGRLTKIFKESFGKTTVPAIKEYQYKYKRTP